MEKLPEAHVKVQTIQALSLPSSSYRMRHHNYARLQPFEVWDDNDQYGNNQLNWTNLFLINKLGHKTLTPADIDVITRIYCLTASDEPSLNEVKVLSAKMSNEFAEIKDQIVAIGCQVDLDNIKKSINQVLSHSDIRNRLSLIEAKMDRLEKLLLKLAKN